MKKSGKCLAIIWADKQNVKNLLYVKQKFVIKAIIYRYNQLKERYLNYPRETRNKSLSLPKFGLTIVQRSSNITLFSAYYTVIQKKHWTLVKKQLKKKLQKMISEFRDIKWKKKN